MQAQAYSLNTDNARSMSEGGRITTTGAYVGQFVRAEAVESTKGTQGLEFSFKTDSGSTADYLTIWTINTEGKELYGRKILDGLMVCARARALTPTNALVKKLDSASGQRKKVNAVVFPELQGKPIGLVLQTTEYYSRSGELKTKMEIAGCFDASSRCTPKEVLDKLPATGLDELLAGLPQIRKAAPPQGTAMAPPPASSGSSSMDSFEDDIPF